MAAVGQQVIQAQAQVQVEELPPQISSLDEAECQKTANKLSLEPRMPEEPTAEWHGKYVTVLATKSNWTGILSRTIPRPEIIIGAPNVQRNRFLQNELRPWDLAAKTAQNFLIRILAENHSSETTPNAAGDLPTPMEMHSYILDKCGLTADTAGQRRTENKDNWTNCLKDYRPKNGDDFFKIIDNLKALIKTAGKRYNMFCQMNGYAGEMLKEDDLITKFATALPGINLEGYKVAMAYCAKDTGPTKTLQNLVSEMKNYGHFNEPKFLNKDLLKFTVTKRKEYLR